MSSRVALAVLVLLFLTVAVGWLAAPDTAERAAPYGTAETVAYSEGTSTDSADGVTATAVILGFMVAGAAAIGLFFFAPNTPKGPRVRVAPSTAKRSVLLFVQRTRRGLADLHQELEVVLGLLQAVDQQVDRLVRIQPGQHTTQLVQHRGLVGAQQ